MKPGQTIRIAGKRVGQNLQRDVAIQLNIAGPTHLPHATFADLRGDFIDAEATTGVRAKRLPWIIWGGGHRTDEITPE